MSITFFFSSALSLPAIRCPDNFLSKSWLCIPQSIASHQSFVSLSKKPFNLNRQLHFLEPLPSRFGFFLVLGGLYIPLLSHCIVKYGLFKNDLSIKTLNPALTPCRRTQPNNSSRSLHLAFVVKNEAVSRTSQTTPIGTSLGSSILPLRYLSNAVVYPSIQLGVSVLWWGKSRNRFLYRSSGVFIIL